MSEDLGPNFEDPSEGQMYRANPNIGTGDYYEARRRRGGSASKPAEPDVSNDTFDAATGKGKKTKGLSYVPVEPTLKDAKDTGADATSAPVGGGEVPVEPTMEHAAATSAQRTSNPEFEPKDLNWAGRNFMAAARDVFDRPPNTAANAAPPGADFNEAKAADAQAHAREGRPDFSEYDRATTRVQQEADKLQNRGFGTKLLQRLAPRFFGHPDDDLRVAMMQQQFAKDKAIDKYLRDNPEAAQGGPSHVVDGSLISSTGKVLYKGPGKPAKEPAPHYIADEGGAVIDANKAPRDANGQLIQNVQVPNPTLAPDFVGPGLPNQPVLVTEQRPVKMRPPGTPKESIEDEARRKGAVAKATAPYKKQPESVETAGAKAKAREAGKLEATGPGKNLSDARAQYNKRMEANNKLDLREKRSPKSVQNDVEKEYGLPEGTLTKGPAAGQGGWVEGPTGIRVREVK